MLNVRWGYLALFVFLVLVQVLVLNNIHLGGYMNPQLYVFLVLLLPLNIPGLLLLSVAFVLGLIIDMFSDSLAIHAGATVFMAFCRPTVIRLVTGQFVAEDPERPSFSSFGTFSMIFYVIALVLAHHAVLFFLEVFRFSEVPHTLIRILLNTGFTALFVLLAFIFSDRPAGKKAR